MRCCVQNCFNDDSNKTNKSHGITFHRIPKDPDYSAAWLEAITRLGYRKNKCLTVCSEHFLPEDFNYERHNQRRVKSGAVPTIMAPVIQEDFKMCRVCLALDVKMYDMKNYKLSEMFKNITGILAIDNKGSIIQRVCWECAARLTVAAAFRDKALFSDALLKDLVHIKKSDIATLKEKHTSLKSNLTVNSTFTSSDIEYEFSISENEGNDTLPNDEADERKTGIRINEEEKDIEFEDEDNEPWIEAPIKTDRESDPLDDMDILMQDPKCETFSELTHADDSFPSFEEDSDNEIRKTNSDNKILREKTPNKRPLLKNGKIVLANEPKLVIVNVSKDEEFSGAEDSQRTAEDTVSKPKQQKKSKVGNPNRKGTIRKHKISDSLEEKIIAMKKDGRPNSTKAKKTGLTANINIEARATIIALYKSGLNRTQISEETGLNRNTVSLWIKRYEQEGSLASRQRSGRPSLISEAQRKHMVGVYETNGLTPTRHFADLFYTSPQTVRRALHAEGLNHRRPARKPFLTEIHKE